MKSSDGPKLLQSISVLIPTLGRPLLEQCVRSIAAGTAWPDRIIIVEQSSKLEPPSWMRDVQARGPRIERLVSSQRGRASAINRGLERVPTRFVSITDDDCTVAADWLERIEELLAHDPVAVITGRVEAAGDEEVLAVATSQTPSVHRRPRLSFDPLSGGNMATSLEVFRRVGLLDEDPRLRFAEDGEWAYRALRSGLAIHYRPEVCVWHHAWRDRSGRGKQYSAYARSHGSFYGKYIRNGDVFIAVRAFVHHLRAVRRCFYALVTRKPDLVTFAFAYVRNLIPGMLDGFRRRYSSSYTTNDGVAERATLPVSKTPGGDSPDDLPRVRIDHDGMLRQRRKYLAWRSREFQRRLRRAVCSRLYTDPHPEVGRSAIIAGTARSGTTWLANIIASQIRSRIMFEPFHPQKVDAYRQFNYFQYLRPSEENDFLLDYCSDLFSGRIRNRWIDRQIEVIRPELRLIKAIRANLLLAWIHERFPEIPLVLIVRHPCAVVLSRMQLEWATDADLEHLLMQPELITDHLADKIHLIEHAETPEEKHAVVWAVHNLVPFKQVDRKGITVVFYENLCLEPRAEISRIFRALRRPYKESVFDSVAEPSATSRRFSSVVAGGDLVARWKTELSAGQIDRILSIVRMFGLGSLYDQSATPTGSEASVPVGSS